jgi:hypothetical protein
MWLLAAVGAGLSLVLPSCPGLSHQRVIRVHAIVALNLYCLFALPATWPHEGLLLLLQSIGVALLSGVWLWAAARRERIFLTHRFFAQVRLRHRAPVTTSAQA